MHLIANYTSMTTTMEFLLSLKKDLEEIQANWNGEESGLQEEAADNASEAIDKLNELLEILTAMNY